mmetsp:Transcript_31810/g.103356  ORF Transcript_31810/g.103356 Transcript_31810/m.103356 type:complete len:402 (-) Transcript_31810:495-1700(-)
MVPRGVLPCSQQKMLFATPWSAKKFESLLINTAGTAGKFEEEMKRRQKITRSKNMGGTPIGTESGLLLPPFEELTVCRLLGQGTFGRVKLVEHTRTASVYTLKCMSKVQVVKQQQEKNVIAERDLLYECASTFVLKLHMTYQSTDELFLLMELIQGGELWQYIYEKKHLLSRTSLGGVAKASAQFYAACVTSALHYVHNKGVAYRDLKPENLLMDSAGYIKMIDFGFAKRIPYKKKGKEMLQTFTLCGTPEYIAPEILLSKGHDKGVDCWALGCLIYELLCGRTPFVHDDQQQIFRAIVQANSKLRFPSEMDADAQMLIKGMLEVNPARRLGNLKDGLSAVPGSVWYQATKFEWAALSARTAKAPYLPPVKDEKDTSNIDSMDDDDSVLKYRGNQDIFFQF